MSQVIGVVNYGMAGNIHSIKKAVEIAGGTVKVVTTEAELKASDKIIIPGVGSFKDAMSELSNDQLTDVLKEAISDRPTLGICLGMQILARVGFEYGETEGLGAIQAEVKPMQVDAKVPHMGFSSLTVVQPNELLRGLEHEEFYFMHSYEVVNYTDIASLTYYAGHEFVSSIRREMLFGVQFHPEKSREAGIRLFKNFLQI